MKKVLCVWLSALLLLALLAGCGSTAGQDAAKPETTTSSDSAASGSAETPAGTAAPADGVYDAVFTTDNSMFHVSEACNNRGKLTVKDGKMTIHVSLVSENIVNLFVGSAADARKSGAAVLQPTTDTVTYSDGTSEEVYGFDIPVPALDQDFDVALLGTKGTWYDHKVSVSDPQPAAK